MLLTLINLGFADVCEENLDVGDFDSYLAALTVSFAEQDIDLLSKNWTKLEAAIPCVTEKLPSESALKFHLLTGLYYAIAEENFKTLQSLSAAKSIDASVSIPTYIFPAGHYVHEQLAEVEIAERIEPTIELDKNQALIFDGVDSARPKDAPTILQLIDDGAVVYTEYIGPYSQIDLPSESDTLVSNGGGTDLEQYFKTRRRRTRRITLGVVSGLAGLAAYSTTQSFLEDPRESTYQSNKFYFGTFVFMSSLLGVDIGFHYLGSKEGK